MWIGLQVVFGTENPFYVAASGSMLPEIQVYDVLVIQAHVPFEDVQIGDIIVFDRPSGHDRVIVHRVVSITDDDPRTLRTKGDNNVASIPGTDFPITEKEYIGTVQFKIPQLGYVTQVLKPPTPYIINLIILCIPIVMHFRFKKENSSKQDENLDDI
jgi:signal peptidase